MRRGGWIQTFTGVQFFPLAPIAERMRVEDIAHALGNLCRFTGHCRRFYSVAEHCVRVSLAVPRQDSLWGLLHDASEAYVHDLPQPLKRLPEFAAYREAERAVERAMCDRFGLASRMPASVREADVRMLFTEKRDLMAPEPAPWDGAVEPYPERIEPWTCDEAERRYLERFRELSAG